MTIEMHLESEIKLFMLGDFVPIGGYEMMLLRQRSAIFGFLKEEIEAADISFLNVEAPLCRGGRPIQKSGPALKIVPEAAQVIAEAGFTVAGLANNHVMDFGVEGLISTRNSLEEAGLHVIGAGLNYAESWCPYVYQQNDRTVALLAVAEREFNVDGTAGAAIADHIDLTSALLELRAKHDAVIVTIHGGNEYYTYPRPGLRRFCKYLVEIGAHAVICHHPHVRGAYETYLGRPIAYSLGNAIFDHSSAPNGWSEGFAAKLSIGFVASGTPAVRLEMIPFVQSTVDGGIRRLNSYETRTLKGWKCQMDATMACDEAYASEWRQFCSQRERAVLSGLLAPVRVPGAGRVITAIRKVGGFRDPSRLNLLRCPSHRELLISILEQS